MGYCLQSAVESNQLSGLNVERESPKESLKISRGASGRFLLTNPLRRKRRTDVESVLGHRAAHVIKKEAEVISVISRISALDIPTLDELGLEFSMQMGMKLLDEDHQAAQEYWANLGIYR